MARGAKTLGSMAPFMEVSLQALRPSRRLNRFTPTGMGDRNRPSTDPQSSRLGAAAKIQIIKMEAEAGVKPNPGMLQADITATPHNKLANLFLVFQVFIDAGAADPMATFTLNGVQALQN